MAFRQTIREGQRPDITCCIGLGCIGDNIPIELACQCTEGLTLHELINCGVLNLSAQVANQTDIGHVVGKIHSQCCAGKDPELGTDRDAPVLDIAHRVEPVMIFKNRLAAVVGVDALHEARSGVRALAESDRDILHVLIEHGACGPVNDAAGAAIAIDLPGNAFYGLGINGGERGKNERQSE